MKNQFSPTHLISVALGAIIVLSQTLTCTAFAGAGGPEGSVASVDKMQCQPSCLAPSGNFTNLFSTISLIFGLAYLVVAVKKFLNTRTLKIKNPVSAVPENGLAYFLFASIFLMSGGIINEHSLSVPVHNLFYKDYSYYTYQPWLISAFAFFPWLMLISLQKFRHLRKQAIVGLCLALLVPLLLVGLLFIAFAH